MPYRVGKQAFGQLVERALTQVPPPFAEYLEHISVEVRDQPTPAELKSLHLRPNELLMGLYQGKPLIERSVEDSGQLPDIIFIFQEPIQQVCGSEEELVEQVRKTVLHEIGHHFGMSEEDLDELGYG